MAGLLLFELGLRLGLQLPGGGARPLPSRPPPPGCPLRVSRPSEFSSISWMRGGIEPGISIFSVITRSAPAREGGRGQHTHTPCPAPSPASPASKGGCRRESAVGRTISTTNTSIHGSELGLSSVTLASSLKSPSPRGSGESGSELGLWGQTAWFDTGPFLSVVCYGFSC